MLLHLHMNTLLLHNVIYPITIFAFLTFLETKKVARTYVMALHCHIWLVLLASIISQCGAIEYYVKPTNFTNDTCPGQPCLTINEYTNASAYYIKSNIAFIFLPGNHISLSPIVIRDVENISIISDNKNTKILAYFSCRDVINSTCIHCPMVPIPEFMMFHCKPVVQLFD